MHDLQFFDTVNVFGKTSFHVSNSNSSSDNVGNLKRMIFNLSLSRYDANLSRLAFENLKESMNRNFMHFRESALSAVFYTCL